MPATCGFKGKIGGKSACWDKHYPTVGEYTVIEMLFKREFVNYNLQRVNKVET
jgi:hypothetical protein